MAGEIQRLGFIFSEGSASDAVLDFTMVHLVTVGRGGVRTGLHSDRFVLTMWPSLATA